MLIDRLGDQFSRATIEQEAGLLCPRVQWVFRSACELIVQKNEKIVADLVMRLVEPQDICKQLSLCILEPHDFMAMGLAGPYGYGGLMRQGVGHPMPFYGGAGSFGHPGFPYGQAGASPYGPYGLTHYGMSGYNQFGNPVNMGGHGEESKSSEE
jgi:hypothetical protein